MSLPLPSMGFLILRVAGGGTAAIAAILTYPTGDIPSGARAVPVALLTLGGILLLHAVLDVAVFGLPLREKPRHPGDTVGVPAGNPVDSTLVDRRLDEERDRSEEVRWRRAAPPEPLPASPLSPWPPFVERFLDIGSVAAAASVAILVATGSQPPFRPAIALVFLLVVPGWALLRACRAPVCSLTLLSAVALSVSIAVLTGEVLAATQWVWRPTVLVVALGSCLLLVAARVRAS